jgi:hypothetical protein
MCMIVSRTLKLLMMFGLSFAILMMALLKLSHLIRTLIIGSIKHFLRNLETLYDSRMNLDLPGSTG